MENKSDSWDAVVRIKRKHEKVIEAAIAVINCYHWYGEPQAKFLEEAVNELDDAVENLGYVRRSQ